MVERVGIMSYDNVIAKYGNDTQFGTRNVIYYNHGQSTLEEKKHLDIPGLDLIARDVHAFYPYDPLYQLTNVEGLAPVPASINITPYAAQHGGVFNTARCDTRNIVVTMKLGSYDDGVYNMDFAREKLYTMFSNSVIAKPSVGEKVLFTVWFTNGLGKWIWGYIENIACDYYGEMEGAQISIICPKPDFHIFPNGYAKKAYKFDLGEGYGYQVIDFPFAPPDFGLNGIYEFV